MSHMNRHASAPIVWGASIVLPLAVAAGPIDTLQPGQWYEVPNSKLSAVFPNPLPPQDPAAAIYAYSGGAYDSDRNRLIVWGGGHNDYGGNEVYAFDIATMAWTRLTDPSTGTPSGETMPDGNPTSIHTYDQLEYIPTVGKLFSTNGSIYPSGHATRATWYFDFSSLTWERLTDTPGSFYSDVVGYSLTTDWDPVSEKMFIVGNYRSANFDPADGSWTIHDNFQEQLHGQTGALDPIRRKFVTIGRGNASTFTLDNNGVAGSRSVLGATGATEIQNVDAPGLVYDPVGRKLVAWGGGKDVYTLDLDANMWTKVVGSGSVDPGDPYVNSYYRGTFGRFRYMPAYNAFIVVTDVDANVFIYQPTDLIFADGFQ